MKIGGIVTDIRDVQEKMEKPQQFQDQPQGTKGGFHKIDSKAEEMTADAKHTLETTNINDLIN